MNIKLRGKSCCIPSGEVRYAVKFMSEILMSKRLCESLDITIQFIDGMKDPADKRVVNADVEWLDDNVSPREFKIRLNNRIRSRRNQLVALAHELVHVKQYARNEIRDVFRGPTRIKWKKEYVDDDTTHYYDLPWEIEAHGREYGLYWRYKQHRRNSKLKFKS